MIERLSLAQRARLRQQVEGWRALQLSTSPADRPKAEAAARLLWPQAKGIVWDQGRLKGSKTAPPLPGCPNMDTLFGKNALKALSYVYYRLIPIAETRSTIYAGNMSVPKQAYWQAVRELHEFELPAEQQAWLDLAEACAGVTVEWQHKDFPAAEALVRAVAVQEINAAAIDRMLLAAYATPGPPDPNKVSHVIHLAERATEIHVRGDSVHKTDGPAVTYRDGSQAWFIGGVAFAPQAAPALHQLPLWLPKQSIAVAMQALEYIGLERCWNYLSQVLFGVKLQGIRGELLKFNCGAGAGGILKLLDPATKEYCYIPVPGWTPIQQGGPRTHSVAHEPWNADDAVAWSFGLKKEEYHPQRES